MNPTKPFDPVPLILALELALQCHRDLREQPFAQLGPSKALTSLRGPDRVSAVVAMIARLRQIADGIQADQIRKGHESRSRIAFVFDRPMHNWTNWCSTFTTLIQKDCKPSTAQWSRMLSDLDAISRNFSLYEHKYLPLLVSKLETQLGHGRLGDTDLAAVHEIAANLANSGNSLAIRLATRLTALTHSPQAFVLPAGEAWADSAQAAINAMPAHAQQAWLALLDHCAKAKGAQPTKKWATRAIELSKPIRPASIAASLSDWLSRLDQPPTILPGDHPVRRQLSVLTSADLSQDILRGLCWTAAVRRVSAAARPLGAAATSAYKKLPGIGPRAIRLGHAAIYALGQIPGKDSLAQLAILQIKIKFRPAQHALSKALSAAAKREGLAPEEIQELAVPSYGMTAVGQLETTLGDLTARISVQGVGNTELAFTRTDGKPLKSVPAAVKQSHAKELKALKLAKKDIATMLSAQRDRIDSMFLDDRSWSFKVWRERYLDHPLLGVLARRLIWSVRDSAEGPWVSVTWLEGVLVDANARTATLDQTATTVRLWHPVGAPQEEVLAWRRFFEDRGIRQPFKQAHREVYLLTDAERRTSTYSNRFAAHIIKQHQFNALAALRGWRNQLRLLVDAEYQAPTRWLDRWDLRAEYWVEGAGDNWGHDTTDSGAFLHLVTDQVRFYRLHATKATAHAGGGGYSSTVRPSDSPVLEPDTNEPLLLETIPPLVFSEIMRDVDLFVGVCSVANNPNWPDGGPHNTYRDYWWAYGFGDLSGSAQSRRDLLSRLLPRLRIAALCTLGEKFLTVRGELRTYKIHLGSGNILMEPNDQYLCIVPTSRDGESANGISLPFEGDRVLSIILSKAFMLAEDDSITDPSITTQIRAH